MKIKPLISLLLSTVIIFSLPNLSYAQGLDHAPPAPSGPRKQLATIVFAGLAGAILGLSTLSFYGRPQDKLSNIAVGFAVGIIGGTMYTTYKTATQPYGMTDFERQMFFAELDNQQIQPLSNQQFNLNYEWNF